MSKKYKVHENFELEHLSWDDENCHCNPPGKSYVLATSFNNIMQNLIIPEPILNP